MGQKVNPVGFRVGVYRDWDARWFARDTSYGKLLLEDLFIRKYLESALEKAEISRIEIEKAGENVKIVIHSGRPGMVIGKKGQEIDTLRKVLGARLKRNVEVSVQEIGQPELDALLVAKNIADQLERRASYKRVMKKVAAAALRAGAKGVKICCAGRLGGAEIARTEWTRVGSVPLHTLRSDVDFGQAEAKTKFGIIGIKVWICRGDFNLSRTRS